jgi:hypothetical protein
MSIVMTINQRRLARWHRVHSLRIFSIANIKEDGCKRTGALKPQY